MIEDFEEDSEAEGSGGEDDIRELRAKKLALARKIAEQQRRQEKIQVGPAWGARLPCGRWSVQGRRRWERGVGMSRTPSGGVSWCPVWFPFSSSTTKFWFGAWSLPPGLQGRARFSSDNLLKASPPVMICEHTPHTHTHTHNLSRNCRGFRVPLNFVQTLLEKPWILC